LCALHSGGPLTMLMQSETRTPDVPSEEWLFVLFGLHTSYHQSDAVL
jgi:hypothetical protein